mgnify:CR=1 FL=1
MKNSLFKKAIRMLTNNIGLKLLAVIVSCGLWFVVNNITDPIKPKNFNNIPVEFINVDAVTNEGKVYEVLDGTNLVNVSVTGKRSELFFISLPSTSYNLRSTLVLISEELPSTLVTASTWSIN